MSVFNLKLTCFFSDIKNFLSMCISFEFYASIYLSVHKKMLAIAYAYDALYNMLFMVYIILDYCVRFFRASNETNKICLCMQGLNILSPFVLLKPGPSENFALLIR